MAATTKPKTTIVSGSATKMNTVPEVSGLSAIAPQPAAPILLCAQAVAKAVIAIAKDAAAACPIFKVAIAGVIACSLTVKSPQV